METRTFPGTSCSVLPSEQDATFLSQGSKVYAASTAMTMSEPSKESRDRPPGPCVLLGGGDETLRRYEFLETTGPQGYEIEGNVVL